MESFYYFSKMVDEKYLREQVIIKINILNYEVISKIKNDYFMENPIFIIRFGH